MAAKKSSTSKAVPLSNLCSDVDIQKDAEFIDNIHNILESPNTSSLLGPYVSQLRVVHDHARRSVRKRITLFRSRNKPQTDEPVDVTDPLQTFDEETIEDDEITANSDDEVQIFDNETIEDNITANDEDEVYKPQVGDYCTIKSGKNSFLYAVIEIENPLWVKYFTEWSNYHTLNNTVLMQDLGKKVSPPKVEKRGKREFYHFE